MTRDLRIFMYNDIISNYVDAFIKQIGFEEKPHFELSDLSSMLTINDELIVNMDDVRYVVDHEIKEKEFFEWYYYNQDMCMLGLNLINIVSWFNGAPRLSRDKIESLYEKKEELNQLLEKYKNDKF